MQLGLDERDKHWHQTIRRLRVRLCESTPHSTMPVSSYTLPWENIVWGACMTVQISTMHRIQIKLYFVHVITCSHGLWCMRFHHSQTKQKILFSCINTTEKIKPSLWNAAEYSLIIFVWQSIDGGRSSSSHRSYFSIQASSEHVFDTVDGNVDIYDDDKAECEEGPGQKDRNRQNRNSRRNRRCYNLYGFYLEDFNHK